MPLAFVLVAFTAAAVALLLLNTPAAANAAVGRANIAQIATTMMVSCPPLNGPSPRRRSPV